MRQLIIIITMLAVAVMSGLAQQVTPNMTTPTPKAEGPVVELLTTEGPVKVVLYDDTPQHRDNFVKLVTEGYYDGLLFHRVIKDFMVQTGDPDSREARPGQRLGAGSPDYTIPAEIEYPRHFNRRGALAAARTGDNVNPERRSSGSQFYIVTGRPYSKREMEAMQQHQTQAQMQAYFRQLCQQHQEEIDMLQRAGDKEALEALRQQLIVETEKNAPVEPIPQEVIDVYTTEGGAPHLDGAYTVFGQVIEGMDVVDRIQQVETDSSDRPHEDVRIIKATLLDK
ncbi:MAG: peptidylprolyl isomerase [Muribaculaceae bacterium]|nr:peptidylprolyl isomerase [Muribaculaceae bacterium]